jgi:alkaline phosphatase D
VSDLAYDNRTGYNAATGEGALGVEFAGTAVSSPSSFGYNSTLNGPYPPAYYLAAAEKLVGNATANTELQWTEGATRGYFELFISRSNATAKYYGIPDVRTRNTNESVLATFVVEDKSNKLSRPVAGGSVKGGALRTVFP